MIKLNNLNVRSKSLNLWNTPFKHVMCMVSPTGLRGYDKLVLRVKDFIMKKKFVM